MQASREELVARFVGHTEEKTKETIQNALGGILFIDEAYALQHSDLGSDFGQEAINTLVNQLDIHKRDLCVIFAGYKDKMLDFLHSNPRISLKDTI